MRLPENLDFDGFWEAIKPKPKKMGLPVFNVDDVPMPPVKPPRKAIYSFEIDIIKETEQAPCSRRSGGVPRF